MKILKGIFYVFFPTIIGSIVGLLIKGNVDYNMLIQPPLSPPSWLFPVVWSIIYLLMGISYFLYRKHSNEDFESVTKLYYTQLAVNALWSIIFFNFKLYFLAFIWILLLDFLVFKLLKKFKYVYPKSYYLNILYFIWILFATYLSTGVYILN